MSIRKRFVLAAALVLGSSSFALAQDASPYDAIEIGMAQLYGQYYGYAPVAPYGGYGIRTAPVGLYGGYGMRSAAVGLYGRPYAGTWSYRRPYAAARIYGAAPYAGFQTAPVGLYQDGGVLQTSPVSLYDRAYGTPFEVNRFDRASSPFAGGGF